jgi:hypothetical protein
MNRRFPIDPVTGARVLADIVEQVAYELRRLAAAVKAIVDDVRAIYDLLAPFVEWLKSKLAGRAIII